MALMIVDVYCNWCRQNDENRSLNKMVYLNADITIYTIMELLYGLSSPRQRRAAMFRCEKLKSNLDALIEVIQTLWARVEFEKAKYNNER